MKETTSLPTPSAPARTAPTPEENIQMSIDGTKNEIAALDRKISKGESELEKMKAVGVSENEVKIQECDLDEMRYKRERKKVVLEKYQKMQAKGGQLNSADKDTYKQREDEFERKEDEAKENRKNLEKAAKGKDVSKEKEKKEVIEKEVSKEEKSMKEKEKDEENSKGTFGNAKDKMEIASLKTQIKMKQSGIDKAKEKGTATPEEIAEKEEELAILKARLAELGGDEE